MALIDAIVTLRRSWEQVLATVEPPVRRRLTTLGRDLVATDVLRRRRAVASELVQVLEDTLPADHPVTAALRGSDTTLRGSSDVLDAELDQLRRELAEVEARLGPHPDDLLTEAKAILLTAPHYRPEELPAALGDPTASGLLLLPVGDGFRLPAFQFAADGRPVAVVVAVNQILRADADPWGVADWWLRGNGWLRGVPATLVGHVPDEALLAAARGEWESD